MSKSASIGVVHLPGYACRVCGRHKRDRRGHAECSKALQAQNAEDNRKRTERRAKVERECGRVMRSLA